MQPSPQPLCPCQSAPAVLRTWEADLVLCSIHGREWLKSAEKAAAKAAIEADDPEALDLAVQTFVQRIQRKPSMSARIRTAVNALLGRQP